MLVAGLDGPVQHHFIHLGGEVFVRHGLQAGLDVICERRSLVDFQQVERQMFGPQRERFIEVSSPAGHRLPRQAGNQIETDVSETCIPQIAKRPTSIICSV